MKDVDRLLGFFENVLFSFDMAFALGSGLHYYFLMLAFGATGLTAAFSLLSLATSTLGKATGAKTDPGQVVRQIIIAAILLAPMPYSPSPVPNQDAIDNFAFSYTHEAGSGNEGGIGTGIYVSAAAHLMHKVSTLFYHLIVQSIDEFLDTHGYADAKMGNTNLWVFKILNRTYNEDLDKGPALRNSYNIYRRHCEDAAARSSASLRTEVWRRFGLFGGFFYEGATLISNPEAGGGNIHDVNAAKDVLENVFVFPQLNKEAPGGLMMHSREHWTSVFSDNDTAPSSPWAIRDTQTINEHTVRFMPSTLYGAYLAQTDDNVVISDDSFNYSTSAGVIKKVKWFPKTCLDLYLFNQLAVTEMREGAKLAGGTSETPLTPEANSMSATVMSRLVQKVISKKTELQHNTLMGDVKDTGISLFAWMEKIKLQTTIPIILGTSALAYALLVALYPLIIAFSVFSSHAGLASLYFKTVALVFFSALLIYIVIKLISAIIVGLMITFQNTAYSDIYTAAKFANLALASQVVLFAGVIAAPILAYVLIFNDSNSLIRSGKGVADGGTALKTSAAAVGAAVAVGSGVGMVAKGGASLLAGAGKLGNALSKGSKPPSTDLIVPPK